jgi:hypothetical protein
MDIIVKNTKDDAGKQAAEIGAEAIRAAIAQNGGANIILATGASQFEMLGSLIALPDIDWSRVTCFHLDENAGMSMEHPASFRRYLKERFVDRLPVAPRAFHYINAETDPQAECARLSDLIRDVEIDVAFIGIGEKDRDVPPAMQLQLVKDSCAAGAAELPLLPPQARHAAPLLHGERRGVLREGPRVGLHRGLLTAGAEL